MPPAIIKITAEMDRKAASILFIPHDSSFFTDGYSIKDISKAKHNGMRIDLAKIKIVKIKNTVASAKNSFWNDIFIFNMF